MDVKLNVCLLLLLVGALCVQGLRLRQESKNEPSFIKRNICDIDGICISITINCSDLVPPRVYCPEYDPDCLLGTQCCW
ncbi:unnamed protein product, partial [Porites evermanni]